MSDLKKELREAHFKFGDVTPNYRSHARDTMVEHECPRFDSETAKEKKAQLQKSHFEIKQDDTLRNQTTHNNFFPTHLIEKPEGPNLTIQENLKSSIEICPKNGKLSSETTNGL